jgi:hypothetical protein
VSFNDAAVATIFDKVISYCMKTGRFDSVNGHEPKSAPASGLTCAVWVQAIRPVTSSGLASTSGLVTLHARVYQNFISRPFDAIDPKVLSAVADIMKVLSGDLDLGGEARAVDLLGMTGESLSAQAGYIDIDRKVYRVMTINVPIIINDMFDQG